MSHYYQGYNEQQIKCPIKKMYIQDNNTGTYKVGITNLRAHHYYFSVKNYCQDHILF